MGSWRFPAPAIRHSRVEFPSEVRAISQGLGGKR